MDIYFTNTADKMPFTNSKYGREEMHLPSWMTQQYVYDEYNKQMATLQGEFIDICLMQYSYCFYLYDITSEIINV